MFDRFKKRSECQRTRDMLSQYIDGRLDPEDTARVGGHLQSCEACRHELEALRAMLGLLHRVPVVSPPRSFAVAEAVPDRRPSPAWAFSATRLATAAAMLLLAFVIAGDAANLFAAAPAGETAPAPGDLTGAGESHTLSEDNRGEANDSPQAFAWSDSADLDKASSEGGLYTWPVRQLEIALAGVTVVLIGTTAYMWRRRRAEVTVNEDNADKGGA